jgi:4-aminobutyrate aminotransferase
MPTVSETLERLLTQSYSPVFLEVINESHLHAGHRFGGVDSHFSVTIVSDSFSGCSRVARHRSVYRTLAQPIRDGIHALKIAAYTPDEHSLVSRANTVLSPVSGHYTQLEVIRGQGCYLYDRQGQGYLDFSSGIGVCSTGHCHPSVVEAIQTQAATLIHGCIGVVYYEPPIALAETLGRILGHGLESVFFTQSGSEAVETAIKLAKYVTKKHKLIAFRGGFHGRTLGALSITTSKEKYRHGYEPLLEGVTFFPYPYAYRCPFGMSETASEARCIQELEHFFSTLDTDVAAAIIEPVMGEGGYVAAPRGFLKALSRLCKERGILLIFDEIQSGFGKTGSWFYFQQIGVIPDIITLAKGIGSGLPLGACVSTTAIMNQWTTGAHGGTYGGNPVTCAAGLATIRVLEPVLPAIPVLATYAKTRLTAALATHPRVGDIRVTGLMIGIELVQDKATKAPDPDLTKAIIAACLAQNLIVISCGIHDNVIRLIPPLIIDQATLENGLNIFIDVLSGHQ